MADSKFTQSLTTLLTGMLISVIAFLILGFNEGIFHDKNIIRLLPIIKSEDLLRNTEGMIKISGVPEVKSELRIPDYDKNLLFTRTVYQEKLNDNWVTVKTEQVWANFDLLGLEIYPENAVKYLNLDQKYINESENERQTIFGFDADSEIIVVGEIKDGIIKGGDSFAISNKSNDILEAELRAQIHYDWWIYKMLSVLLLSIGIIAFLLPLLDFFEVIQELGILGLLIAIGASIALSFILVAIETVIFSYWFLISLILLFLGYMFIRIFVKKKRKPINVLPD